VRGSAILPLLVSLLSCVGSLVSLDPALGHLPATKEGGLFFLPVSDTTLDFFLRGNHMQYLSLRG
jgi:hypothetical protein